MTLSMIRKYKIVNPLTMIILEVRKIAYYNIRYFAQIITRKILSI